MLDHFLVAGIAFVINLLPAFGSPTAAVLVAATLSFDLASAPLIVSETRLARRPVIND